jgi:uncharacterized protein YjiS (DUF1127 family)
MLNDLFLQMRRWRDAQRLRKALAQFDEHMLRDIGLEPSGRAPILGRHLLPGLR